MDYDTYQCPALKDALLEVSHDRQKYRKVGSEVWRNLGPPDNPAVYRDRLEQHVEQGWWTIVSCRGLKVAEGL